MHGALVAGLLVAAAVAAWSNSLGVPFLLDDEPAITGNPSVRDLGSWRVLWPDVDGGATAAGRPLVNASLALNWAVSADRVWSYHVFNLAVHIAAGLVLWAVVRRACGAPGVWELRARIAGSRGVEEVGAFFTAAIWMLHPLQTAAVTYIVQRAEAMAALCALVTLYAFARSVAADEGESPASGLLRGDRRTGSPKSGLARWRVVSVGACLAGMATKETAVVVPVLVLLYDRTFVAGSYRAAWQARSGYYAALGATWLLLAAVVLGNAGRGGTAGFGTAVTPGEYFLTQCGAIVHYLRLVIWPSPLVFDYGRETVAGVGTVWWQFLLLLGLGVATFVALVRRPVAGFVGAWFFLCLAPSSSFVPVASQTIAEHRMYLALAAPVVLVVAGVQAWLGRRGWVVLAGLAVAAGGATFARNGDYATAVSLWTDTVAKRPANPRAHHNLGLAKLAAGDAAAAEKHLRDALALAPRSAESHYNLALVLARRGRTEEAGAHYRESLALEPAQAAAHHNLANLLMTAGNLEAAGRHYAEAVRLQPGFAGGRSSYGNWLLAVGRPAEALAQLAEAVRLEPDVAEWAFRAGNACAALGRFEEAAGHFREAARLDPGHAAARNNLGNVLLELDRLPEAMAEFEAALRLEPGYFEPRRTLALLYLMHLNRPAEARVHLEILARARPGDREIAEALALARARGAER